MPLDRPTPVFEMPPLLYGGGPKRTMRDPAERSTTPGTKVVWGWQSF